MSQPSPPSEPPDGRAPRGSVGADRSAQAPRAPKRFWRDAALAAAPTGFAIHLDGKPARTPGRRPLLAPDERVAKALVEEWRTVGERIDPASMPLTRLLTSAIDGVADHVEAVRADLAKYAGSDALCYRAAEPDKLVARQREQWDPILIWLREAFNARFILAEGVIFTTQPAETLTIVRRLVDQIPAPYTLAAAHSVTTLTGSALLALALERGAFGPDAVWRAAHVDEDLQMEIWGADEEALTRRALRRREFDAAVLLLTP